MTTLSQEAVMPRSTSTSTRTSSLRRFWVATALLALAVVAISGVVALATGPDTGKIVFVTAVLVTSAVMMVDGVIAFCRRNRG